MGRPRGEARLHGCCSMGLCLDLLTQREVALHPQQQPRHSPCGPCSPCGSWRPEAVLSVLSVPRELPAAGAAAAHPILDQSSRAVGGPPRPSPPLQQQQQQPMLISGTGCDGFEPDLLAGLDASPPTPAAMDGPGLWGAPRPPPHSAARAARPPPAEATVQAWPSGMLHNAQRAAAPAAGGPYGGARGDLQQPQATALAGSGGAPGGPAAPPAEPG